MSLQWVYKRFEMDIQGSQLCNGTSRFCKRFAVGSQCSWKGFAMSLQWSYKGFAVGMQWACNGLPTD